MLINTKIPIRYLYRKIRFDILRVLLISSLFHILKLFYASYLPVMPLQLPTVLGTSISLILAFRINQSYDRWWEARKVWGAIVNDSRTLVLQLKGFVREVAALPGLGPSLLRQMAYRQIAWCYCLGQTLREQDPLARLEPLLPETDLAFLRTQRNKPYGLLALHTQDLKTLYEKEAINAYQQVQLDSTLTRLGEAMGRSERINNTVFPVTYGMFVHFFIYLFLIVLSLALVETIGIYEIPVLTAIASTFFLLEKTAEHLQEPFRNKPTDVPVTAIARTIEINIRQQLQDPEVPEPLAPEKFYLL